MIPIAYGIVLWPKLGVVTDGHDDIRPTHYFSDMENFNANIFF